MSFLKKVVKKFDDLTIMADGKASAEFAGFIDTGSYSLNAGLSGSIYGGLADNKVLALAGETTVGKTFMALGVVKTFLDRDPTAIVIYFDTESAVTRQMMRDRGIDDSRVVIAEPSTIEEFRTRALNILEEYEKTDDREPMMMVLDSLGMLSSIKETGDIVAGDDKRDMTKQQLLRGAFRTLRLKLSKVQVPMIVTNHTYEVIGSYVPKKEMSGGGGLKFAADIIAFISKQQEKDEKTKEVIGNVLTFKMVKSRLSRADTKVHVLLTYDKGFDRYYGLEDIAFEHGIFKKLPKGVEANGITFPSRDAFDRLLRNEPEKIYTKAVLDQIEQAVKADFQYGIPSAAELLLEETEDNA